MGLALSWMGANWKGVRHVDSILKRGVASAAVGTWEICSQDGRHIQEGIRTIAFRCDCGLFIDQLPSRQPGQPRSWA